MLCNPVSYYPNKIDAMTFFQDNNLENVEIMKHYNNLIAQGNYSEANDYISQQEGIYGFFADFFNLIENRIYTLQEYLLNKPPKKQPFIYYDEEERFSISDIRVFDDGDIEEDISSIKSFSDDSENGEAISDYNVYANYKEEHEEDLSSIILFSDNDEESIDDLFLFTGEEAEPPYANEKMIWI